MGSLLWVSYSVLTFCVGGTFKFKPVHYTSLCAICVMFNMCYIPYVLAGDGLGMISFWRIPAPPSRRSDIRHFSLTLLSLLHAFLSSLTSF